MKKPKSDTSNACNSEIVQDALDSIASMRTDIQLSEQSINMALTQLDKVQNIEKREEAEKMKQKCIRTRQKIQEDKRKLDKIESALRMTCRKS